MATKAKRSVKQGNVVTPGITGLHLWEVKVGEEDGSGLLVTTQANNIRHAVAKGERWLRASRISAVIGRVTYLGTLDA